MKRIRTITSHVGHARYLAGTFEAPIGFIPRDPGIASPYHYSLTWPVWQHDSDGAVVIVETRHKRFEVFAVPAQLIRASEEEITG